MDLNKLVSDNYNQLNKVAYNMTGNKSNAADLVSETYLEMIEKKINYPIIKIEFIKFYSAFMRNLKNWTKERYRKQLNGKEILIELEYTDPKESEPCKECLFNELDLFKKGLPAYEKTLFELHYESRISCRMIAEELTLEFKYVVTKKSIEKLMLPIRNKLKINKWQTI